MYKATDQEATGSKSVLLDLDCTKEGNYTLIINDSVKLVTSMASQARTNRYKALVQVRRKELVLQKQNVIDVKTFFPTQLADTRSSDIQLVIQADDQDTTTCPSSGYTVARNLI